MVWVDLVSEQGPLPGCHSFAIPSCGGGGKGALWGLFYDGTSPPMRALPLWPNYLPNTLFPNISHIWISGGRVHKHSVYGTCFMCPPCASHYTKNMLTGQVGFHAHEMCIICCPENRGCTVAQRKNQNATFRRGCQCWTRKSNSHA